MFLEQLRDLAVVLIRHEAHRNLGRSLRRNDRLGPLARVAAPDAVDVERRAHAGAFQRRVTRFALHVADFQRLLVILEAERRLVERLALGGRQLPHVVVEAGDRHAAVLIDESRHQPRQHVGRVGHRTAEQPRMQVLVRSRHLDLHVGQSAQSAGDRRRLHRDHRRVRHQYNIGLEQLLVLLAEAIEARRTDLLLAFEHEFHVAGQRIGGAHRLERLGVHPQLSLVVVGAAAPDAAVADDRLEGSVRHSSRGSTGITS